MGIVTATIKRNGKVIGRSQIVTEGDVPLAAIKASGEAVRKQAKAHDVAAHTGRKRFRKKKSHA